MKKFFESIHYEPLYDRLQQRNPVGSNISFSDRNSPMRNQILGYFDEMSHHHVGILHGEYALAENGWLLVDRKGVMTIGCIPFYDPVSVSSVWISLLEPTSPWKGFIDRVLMNWDRFPVSQNSVVLSEYNPRNYWHFSLEMIPRLRFLVDVDHATCIIPHTFWELPFQQDLLARATAGMSITRQQGVVRVIDPVLMYDSLSTEGVLWLRRATGLAACPGNRRIHIQRSPITTRSGGVGNISDLNSFQALLRDFAFETVAFGNGEHDVAAQVAMLDGAGLILSPHGAGMANLAYVDSCVKVIEVISAKKPSAAVIHLATAVGFDYHGLYTGVGDNLGNVVVDTDELRDVLHARVQQ